jgi:tetratricopeptide (TPR) repeat protein
VRTATPAPAATPAPVDDLRGYLSTLDRDQLVDLLITTARPERLRAVVRSAMPAVVEQAFTPEGPPGFWSTIRYAQRAAPVASALDAMAPSDALPLLERALTLLPAVDALGDLRQQLLASHASACCEVRPDPVALGRWLGRLHHPVDLSRYAPVLDSVGLAAYRHEIGQRWAADPTDAPTRYALSQLARLDGDVETLVELFGEDLRTSAQYARLARTLHSIGACDEAIRWAERGLRVHPDGADLRDFLVEAYLHRGSGSDAIAMRRDGLRATPHLQAYAALRAAAGHAGRWPAERPAALRALRRHNPADHVRALLLEEGDPEAAWSAARKVPDLDGPTWDDLARHRAHHHPAQALPVLRRRLEEVLTEAARRRAGREVVYRDAVLRLVELREVSARAGKSADFDEYLRELLERCRRRPAFLAEVAQAGLTAL